MFGKSWFFCRVRVTLQKTAYDRYFQSRLKGHKRICPFKDCSCAKCQVVTERQKLMADQIKVRRHQRKQTIMNLTRDNLKVLNAVTAAAVSNPQPYISNLTNLNMLCKLIFRPI